MGVGYSVSALHRIENVDWSENALQTPSNADRSVADLFKVKGFTKPIVKTGPLRSTSNSKAQILSWRANIASKYNRQLGEDLMWDEDSEFEQSEDVSTSDDVLLRYVASVIDQRGARSADELATSNQPSQHEIQEALTASASRSFGSGFPQLLLGATYWLPFERHMIIEEPNWIGDAGRYGSIPRLNEEVVQIQTFIETATSDRATGQLTTGSSRSNVLNSAGRVAEVIARLCNLATTRRLPMWTTG